MSMLVLPELWAGAECSVVRIGDRYVDQVQRTAHESRHDDMDRLASLGARAVRFPVLWERTAPGDLASADWSFADAGLSRLRELGIRPIVGLVHHGSGPPHTSLLEASFVTGLARFARAVAERYPWIVDFTPVNEPLTTARFSALYGHWYPHARCFGAFVRVLMNEHAATREAMRAIREVTPSARLVQTEDLGTIYATRHLAYQARFENHRRFLSLDLLTGRVGPRHPMYRYLVDHGVSVDELASFVAAPCPPDILGLNHYVTSDRFLDERMSLYPPHTHGGNDSEAYADVEAVRVRGPGIGGHRALLDRLWRRYGLPLAITEVHLACAPQEQVRWLFEAWNAALDARRSGVDVRGVTVWSAFGAYDWDSLLVCSRDRYEPGAFDVRGPEVVPTPTAHVAHDLAMRGTSDHPMLAEPGWWRRPDRLIYPPVGLTLTRGRDGGGDGARCAPTHAADSRTL
jgi:dTDP-4-dehydrorhamnose reductase